MPIRKQLIALNAVVSRELRRIMRISVQTILPPVITTTLYFIIFGKLIGSQLAPVDGYSYMEYIVPGLILMSVITNAYANTVSSFYSSKFQRSIEEMLVSPMPSHIIMIGYVTGGVVRGLAVGFCVLGVSLLFVPALPTNPALALLIATLTATMFSIGGLINGVFAKSFDDISIIPTFVLMPLTYLGGIFYSIAALPQFWRDISLFNPILYMINAFRLGMIGGSDLPLIPSLAIIIGFILALGAIALRLLAVSKGIRA